MEIINIDINESTYFETPSDLVLCLGYFDGVHLGHKKLIEEALKRSSHVGVLTLDRNPKDVLESRSSPSLTSLYDKKEIFDSLGVEYLFILPFNKGVSLLSKDEFIHQVIDCINPSLLVVGEDYRFGFRAAGDPAFLSLFYPTSIIPLFELEGEKVSSSKIISLIKEGYIDKANALLSRPYFISGLVVDGLKNGSKNGLPTANIELDYNYVVPLQGVYATYTYIDGERYKSLTCISTHPTIQELDKASIETYIFDFNKNIYGKTITIAFIARIRDIYTYPTIDSLKEQILKDIKESKKYL